MSRSTGVFAAVMGLGVLIAGAVVGFRPISRQGVSCGAPFEPGRGAVMQDIRDSMTDLGPLVSAANACDAALSTWRLVALVAIALGFLAVTTVYVTAGRRSSASSPQPLRQ